MLKSLMYRIANTIKFSCLPIITKCSMNACAQNQYLIIACRFVFETWYTISNKNVSSLLSALFMYSLKILFISCRYFEEDFLVSEKSNESISLNVHLRYFDDFFSTIKNICWYHH